MDIVSAEGIFAFLAGMAVLGSIVGIAVYIFMGFSFMTLGKKLKQSTPELAWIPGVGPLIIAYKASKMHWWPWLLLIGIIIPFVNFLAMLAFTVFAYIWLWKMFEALKKPGWWPLLSLIPVIGGLIFLILVGITAWGKE